MQDNELVERVAQEICRAGGSGLCVGFCHSKRCTSAIEQYEQTARAIIPIVQAEQRERDARRQQIRKALRQYPDAGLKEPVRDLDAHSGLKTLATAIRNQEPTDER